MRPRSQYHESTAGHDAAWEIWTGCSIQFHTLVDPHKYEQAMDQFRAFETKLNRFIEENKPTLWEELDIRDNYGQIGPRNDAS